MDSKEILCHQIYDVLPISPALKLLDDGKLYALITAHDEAIRRECADSARRYLDGLPYYEGGYTNGLHAAILGAETAQDDGEPKVGDIVYHEDRIRAWDYADEEMKDKYINKAIVLMRAAEVKRRTEEAEI